MTVEEKLAAKKPITKRDVAKFLGGKAAGLGGMLLTDGILIPVAFSSSKAFKHPRLMCALGLWTTYCVSFKVFMDCDKLGTEVTDEICDIIVTLDDIRKLNAEIKKEKEVNVNNAEVLEEETE